MKPITTNSISAYVDDKFNEVARECRKNGIRLDAHMELIPGGAASFAKAEMAAAQALSTREKRPLDQVLMERVENMEKTIGLNTSSMFQNITATGTQKDERDRNIFTYLECSALTYFARHFRLAQRYG